MAKFCGNCGSPLNATAIFCGGCGTRVPAGPPPPPSIPPPASEQAGFAPVLPAFPPAASPAADLATAAVPASFTSVPEPVPPPAGFAPVQGDFAAAPAAPAAYSPVQPSYATASASYTPAPAAYTPGIAYPPASGKKSNTLLKIIIALVVILFVGGALALGGLWYAAQKIKEKAHAAATQALGGNAAAAGGLGQMLGGVAGLKANADTEGFKGDPCRFLSKAEVSQAVGIQVIRAEAQDDGCSYIAHGDPADVTAKHMSSMLGGLGADPKTQKQIQKLAGGFFAQQEAGDKDLRAQAATGEIPVLVTRYTSGNAQAEMKLNRGAFTYVTGGAGTASSSGSGDLDGIGDEAYLAGGSMLIFRKGNSVAHFTYISCPCNTGNIKPLARLVASRL